MSIALGHCLLLWVLLWGIFYCCEYCFGRLLLLWVLYFGIFVCWEVCFGASIIIIIIMSIALGYFYCYEYFFGTSFIVVNIALGHRLLLWALLWDIFKVNCCEYCFGASFVFSIALGHLLLLWVFTSNCFDWILQLVGCRSLSREAIPILSVMHNKQNTF